MNKVATELEESYLLSRFQVTGGLGDHCSTSLGHLWAFGCFLQTCLYNNVYNSSARKGFCAEEL